MARRRFAAISRARWSAGTFFIFLPSDLILLLALMRGVCKQTLFTSSFNCLVGLKDVWFVTLMFLSFLGGPSRASALGAGLGGSELLNKCLY